MATDGVVPPRAREVWDRLDATDTILDELAKESNMLFERLEPVCQPQAPATAATPEGPGCTVTLARRLEGIRSRVTLVTENIRDILRRLEI